MKGGAWADSSWPKEKLVSSSKSTPFNLLTEDGSLDLALFNIVMSTSLRR